MDTKNTVAVLLVIKNEANYLPKFLDSIKNQTHKNINVYLFDNNSTDNSVSVVKDLYPAAKIFSSNTNIGFAKANNILAQKAFGDGAEFIFILNPDIILDKFCVEILIIEIKNNQEIGIIAPIMLSGDTDRINSFGTIVNFKNYKEEWPFRDKLYSEDLPEINFVDTVGGGVTFLPKSTYLKTGLFEESYFIYGEEIDLGYRVKNIGLKAAVCSKAIAKRFHDSKKDLPEALNFKYYYKMRSEFLYLVKFKFYFGAIKNLFHYLIRFPKILLWSLDISDFWLFYFFYLGIAHGIIGIKGKAKVQFK